MATYYSLLTVIGAARMANAHVTKVPVNLTHMAVGDGGGAAYDPVESQTALAGEVWRGSTNALSVHADNPNWLVIEVLIPADVGGWTVREAGVFDDAGNLIAIAKYPESYKPMLAEGSGKDLNVRMILEVSNADSVTLLIDPSIVLATRSWVENRIEDHVEDGNPHPNLVVPTATTEQSGKVELATVAEAREGADATRAVTPEGLGSALSVLRKRDLINQLFDAMAEGDGIRILDADADPYEDTAKIDDALSSAYTHDPINATVTPVDGPVSAIYDAPGSYDWTVPDGVTSVDVQAWGGGAGGGSGWHGTPAYGGGGGGGGGYSAATIAVTPGETITITVGVGGGGSAGAYVEGQCGEDGGETSFGAYLSAGGGTALNNSGFNYSGSGVGGAGGIGTTENGSDGQTSTNQYGGAGGDAGGAAQGGGSGGAQQTSVGSPGNDGTEYGGGGSGGTPALQVGGDGAPGAIVLDYVVPPFASVITSTAFECASPPLNGYVVGIVEPDAGGVTYDGTVFADLSNDDGAKWETVALEKIETTDQGLDIVYGEIAFANPGTTALRGRWRASEGVRPLFHARLFAGE